MDFSLFFFSNYQVDVRDKYKLLLEAVKFADAHNMKAVWTPERHFHEFGGIFPNPSVISAALAMITEHIELRSGSVVSPLHDPIRIAEEWAVVDNLSNGRVALSFASGWNSNDFILAKENYADRHKIMDEQIDMVRRLWRGETFSRKNGIQKEVVFKIYPSPIQRELPVWVTAAGNEKTYIDAGGMGANLLTHLLGQEIEVLAAKIALYRSAREQAGYDPATGRVALMLHTYVGDEGEDVMQKVEKPFIEYLRSATGLSKVIYEEAGFKPEDIPEEDKEMMLRYSFMRYSRQAALIGTVEDLVPMIENLADADVDEIACLVDFGVDADSVLARLENLNTLQNIYVT
jgi:natural product biosynthesis luciferase-like monooxygenase protein